MNRRHHPLLAAGLALAYLLASSAAWVHTCHVCEPAHGPNPTCHGCPVDEGVACGDDAGHAADGCPELPVKPPGRHDEHDQTRCALCRFHLEKGPVFVLDLPLAISTLVQHVALREFTSPYLEPTSNPSCRSPPWGV